MSGFLLKRNFSTKKLVFIDESVVYLDVSIKLNLYKET